MAINNQYAVNANARQHRVSVHAVIPGVHSISALIPPDTGYVAFKPNSPLFEKQPYQPPTVIEGQTPENPGLKTAAFSTYGLAIPVSLGRRFIAGNIIDASDLEPRLVGYREYYTEERVYPEDTGGGVG